jgi:preprotein translocase subunit SecA
MAGSTLPRIVPVGAYPERADPRPGRLEAYAGRAAAPVVRRLAGGIARQPAFVGSVAEHGAGLAALDDASLRAAVDEVRERLPREGFERDVVARAFALVRETATRTLGQRHFDVQLIGGLALLRGIVAEMDTGEGKTLTATLAAATAALAGVPVHVITVNDYLAARDADTMRPLYEALGLRVGTIVGGLDPDTRRRPGRRPPLPRRPRPSRRAARRRCLDQSAGAYVRSFSSR